MPPGRYPRWVTIKLPTSGKDAAGAPATTWTTDLFSGWASRESLPGREVWQAMQVTAKVPVRYRMPPREGVTTKMRLYDGDRVFDIKSVDPDGGNRTAPAREMVLLCEEVS